MRLGCIADDLTGGHRPVVVGKSVADAIADLEQHFPS
jgi:hypothetical protein